MNIPFDHKKGYPLKNYLKRKFENGIRKNVGLAVN